MHRFLFAMTLTLGTLAPAISSAGGSVLGNLPGKYVRLDRPPLVTGLKQSWKMSYHAPGASVDPAYVLYSRPRGDIKYVQYFADGGNNGVFYKKVATKK